MLSQDSCSNQNDVIHVLYLKDSTVIIDQGYFWELPILFIDLQILHIWVLINGLVGWLIVILLAGMIPNYKKHFITELHKNLDF